MTRDKVYIVNLSKQHGFRRGIPAEIVGIEMVTPDKDSQPALYYHVRWADATENWIKVGIEGFKLISFTDILNGKIPALGD